MDFLIRPDIWIGGLAAKASTALWASVSPLRRTISCRVWLTGAQLEGHTLSHLRIAEVRCGQRGSGRPGTTNRRECVDEDRRATPDVSQLSRCLVSEVAAACTSTRPRRSGTRSSLDVLGAPLRPASTSGSLSGLAAGASAASPVAGILPALRVSAHEPEDQQNSEHLDRWSSAYAAWRRMPPVARTLQGPMAGSISSESNPRRTPGTSEAFRIARRVPPTYGSGVSPGS